MLVVRSELRCPPPEPDFRNTDRVASRAVDQEVGFQDIQCITEFPVRGWTHEAVCYLCDQTFDSQSHVINRRAELSCGEGCLRPVQVSKEPAKVQMFRLRNERVEHRRARFDSSDVLHYAALIPPGVLPDGGELR